MYLNYMYEIMIMKLKVSIWKSKNLFKKCKMVGEYDQNIITCVEKSHMKFIIM
jgi:hypothetical protein